MERMEKKCKNSYTVVDFFCGAGIGAVGIDYSGFNTIFAFDNDKSAVNTYNANFEHKAVLQDILELDINDIPYADVYVGGFPCQPFSLSGKNLGKNDPNKGGLGDIFADIINIKKPLFFLIENVGGLVNKKHKEYFNSIIEKLSINYDVSFELLNCDEYGVPQSRKRIFIVGKIKHLKGTYQFPEKSPLKYSVLDAIGDLPHTPNNENNHDYNLSYFLRPDEKPFAHKIPVGHNWRYLDVEDQKAFLKGAFNSGGGRTGFLRKIRLDEPAKTILSSPMGKNTAQILDYGINEPRRFTVRESLRLQTVPDHFYFPNTVSISKQYHRCSGIPSLMAYKLMLSIKKILDLNNTNDKDL